MAIRASIFLIAICLAVSTSGLLRGSEINADKTIQFSLFAKDLKDCDWITACDTSVLLRCSSIYTDWKPCGRTRVIRNRNNPVWPEIFTFDHEPGTSQRLRLDLREHGFIGTKLIATFMVIVDEYAQMQDDLLMNQIPGDKGTLFMQRLTNTNATEIFHLI